METVFRDIRKEEEAQVSNFMVRIFNEFVAPRFSEEGIKTFLNSSGVEQLRRRLKRGDFVQVADKQGEIVGAIEVRDNTHISRFFVEGRYQRQGIGRDFCAAFF